MSIHMYVYIGPYLNVTGTDKMKKKISHVSACSNVNCVNHKNEARGGFCSFCGGKIGKMSVETDVLRTWDDDLDDINSYLFEFPDNPGVLLPNKKIKGMKTSTFSEYEGLGVFDITVEKVAKDKLLFEEFMKPQMDKIYLLNGFEVEVCYGAINYYA